MRFTIAFLTLLALTATGYAQTPYVDRIEILQSGIFTAQKTATTAVPGATGGAISSLSGIQHVRTTDSIPGQLGIRFGFRFKIIGRPDGASVTLRYIILTPPPGIRDPKSGNTIMRSEYSRERTVGQESYRDFGFDDAWEIVPGVWTFEIWQGDRKLTSKTFTVTRP